MQELDDINEEAEFEMNSPRLSETIEVLCYDSLELGILKPRMLTVQNIRFLR